MRVLLIFSSSDLGGAERSLTRMALATRGEIQIELATLGGYGPWVDWCIEQGVTPHVFGISRRNKRQCFWCATSIFKLIMLVRRENYDAIYIIGLRASVNIRLVKPFLRGARIVHGVRWNPASNSRLDKGFRLAERYLGSLVDLYIANSLVAAKTMIDRVSIPKEKIRVIYNGLSGIPKEENPIAERPLQVITIANISPRKGYLQYVENVVAPLCRKIPCVNFVIVGRDDMAGAVQRKALMLGLEKCVRFEGFQSDVSGFLRRSRVFVLPSLWNEGCPTSILEAMAYGVPIVAFSLDGIPELVVHEVDGILVTLNDYSSMKESIERLLLNPEEVERMGRAGYKKVSADFTIENTVKEHVAAFKMMSGD